MNRRMKLGSRAKLILLLFVPSTLFVFFVVQIAKDYTLGFLRETQNEALAGMSSQVTHLITIYNNEITYNMLELEQTIKQEGGAGESLGSAMHTAAQIRSDFVRGIVYIRKDGVITGYPQNFWGNFSEKEEQLVRKQAQASSGVFEWSNTIRSDIGRTGAYGPTSLVTKTVFDEAGSPSGYLAFLVDLSAFLERSAAFAGSYDTQTLLYDSDDKLIDYIWASPSGGAKEFIAEKNAETLDQALRYFKQAGIYHSVSYMKTNLRWKVIVVGDVNKLESRFKPLGQIAWSLLLFGLIGFLGIYVTVSWWFTRPILALTKGIRKVARGDLEAKVRVKQRDELGELAHQFNQMTVKISDLVAGLQRTEEAKRQSDMQVLLSQINPHFLYNTLNTIDIMVDVGTKRELHDMMEVLCRLLKYSLDDNQQPPLAEELRYAADYLHIQSVRYGSRFRFRIEDPPPELARMPVMKLVLQPIVENAVFHGLHALEGRAGELDVAVRSEDRGMVIYVRDNGVGIPEERLALLRQALREDAAPGGGHGIGVLNVHRRIRLHFGERYGLSVRSEPGEGTTIAIVLPRLEAAGRRVANE
ncbi:cache domain-containing sensor histidine kinase [Paenibacillus glycinis]|uniref:histidine kinase n=1 Tax=Paenibacillus glycinis TaxID=2697035 RepID=A0ABW9Y0F3_9BACL|nr:sensor histidine kinase [Paenibacillus glycinis]NBD27959.1 HAMP domain-containing protein [Paenibacillus glycinis]